jgi:hypothetical protein
MLGVAAVAATHRAEELKLQTGLRQEISPTCTSAPRRTGNEVRSHADPASGGGYARRVRKVEPVVQLPNGGLRCIS